jgi:8-oxo-dGTP pyrophosphatase MutT (NUDIX family)
VSAPARADLDAPARAPGALRVRPRYAATLILVRHDLGAPKILMGRRSGGHDFMPDKWVFPGGRVDRGDWAAAAASELRAEVETAVAVANGGEGRRRLARALAMAAVRETFEEAGLLLARRTDLISSRGVWGAFQRAAAGAADLGALSFVARAVTPPDRPKRFDASFFTADAGRLLALERKGESGELDEIGWFGFSEIAALDLPFVTRLVADDLQRRLGGGGGPPLMLARPDRLRERRG